MEAYYYIKYLGFCSIILFFPIEQSLVNNGVPPVDYSWITIQENDNLFLREQLIAISIKSSPMCRCREFYAMFTGYLICIS